MPYRIEGETEWGLELGIALQNMIHKRHMTQAEVADKLGVACEFVVIDWDLKIMELDSKNIDVVWNGMTLTQGVLEAMNCTNAYCNNAQVIILPAAK